MLVVAIDVYKRQYEDRTAWARKLLVNIAKAGFLSSDRAIDQYNKDIWNLKSENKGAAAESLLQRPSVCR